MEQKSKPVTTSVPTIAIKFHANAEHVEELFGGSDDECSNIDKAAGTTPTSTFSNIGEPESSPLKYFPRLVKRSTSIDVSTQQTFDNSPPSDPWRFFSDIKGKITKSVEEKITEIKSKKDENSSPHKTKPASTTNNKDNNSSLSDSEDLSESSISRTCGIVSTTEGVEMSSDDETPSLDKDGNKRDTTKKMFSNTLAPSSGGGGLRHRFRLLKHKAPTKEGTVKISHLSKLYNINTEKVDQALPEDMSVEVENAVDALEDTNLKVDNQETTTVSNEFIIKSVADKIDNIEIDEENVVNFHIVEGNELQNSRNLVTVFAPTGFVDLRTKPIKQSKNRLWIFVAVAASLFYIFLQNFSPYLAGFVTGTIVAFICAKLYIKLNIVNIPSNDMEPIANPSMAKQTILEIPAVKEYQPLNKFEGWINEYPELYNPQTYHIAQTQSVYLRLQGNLLRISNTKNKVPKRAMWNEPEIKPNFTHHRIYNLLGAKIALLPEGLAKKRQWSKKYPICITLNKDQLNFDPEVFTKFESEEDKDASKQSEKSKPVPTPTVVKEKTRTFRFRKKGAPIVSARFSKLTEDEEEFEIESDSRASSPSPDLSDPANEDSLLMHDALANDDDLNSLPDDWSTFSPDESPTEIHIYLFGRTDREKEDWFRRLTTATHKTANVASSSNDPQTDLDSLMSEISDAAKVENEYMKYMLPYIKPPKKLSKTLKLDKDGKPVEDEESAEENVSVEDHQISTLWMNAFIGRILFDCIRDPNFSMKVRERIQRKLAAIKLPYFIEELLVTELSLGKTAPLIQQAGKPVLDQRGLWVDIDVNYDGMIVLTLQTKVNLMKLKNPHAHEKPLSEIRSAIFHSDVDDSAESSSDEEGGSQELPSSMDSSFNSTTTAQSGSSNSGKKFIKMVDRIAESKIFQAATENKYIKKAMEGVSNTDLRLKVEVRGLFGTLVLNMSPPPSDRIWVGFRPTTELLLSAHPIVGERNITFMMVTTWIEKKLLQEFQKIMVIPNMEDFVIPVMTPKLPE